MVLGFGRWAAKEVAKKLLKSKTGGVGSITGVRPGAKFKGQKTKKFFTEAGKKKKKEAQEAEFLIRPHKDPSKEWDQALQEYVKKK